MSNKAGSCCVSICYFWLTRRQWRNRSSSWTCWIPVIISSPDGSSGEVSLSKKHELAPHSSGGIIQVSRSPKIPNWREEIMAEVNRLKTNKVKRRLWWSPRLDVSLYFHQIWDFSLIRVQVTWLCVTCQGLKREQNTKMWNYNKCLPVNMNTHLHTSVHRSVLYAQAGEERWGYLWIRLWRLWQPVV